MNSKNYSKSKFLSSAAVKGFQNILRTKYTDKNIINVITLGCSKNTYDSEVLMGQLKANNKNVVHDSDGNIVVINTCGFIENAKQQSIDTILENVKKKKTHKFQDKIPPLRACEHKHVCVYIYICIGEF